MNFRNWIRLVRVVRYSFPIFTVFGSNTKGSIQTLFADTCPHINSHDVFGYLGARETVNSEGFHQSVNIDQSVNMVSGQKYNMYCASQVHHILITAHFNKW